MMWQLKRLSTGEALSEPGPLPNNWGPIFGMPGIKDRLGDLSWLGDSYADQGWVEVEGDIEQIASEADLVWEKAKQMLRDSDWSVLPDVPMYNENRQQWIEYRKQLRDIRLQTGFPKNIIWPSKPE